MSDPAILFVKPKAISRTDKRALKAAGIIIVEIENPADVKFVRAHSELSGSELLLAAAQAIGDSGYSSVRDEFAKAICAAIKLRINS